MTPIKKAAGSKTTTATNSVSQTHSTGADLALTTTSTEARIDSRLLAMQLDNQHRHVMALLDKYMGKVKTFGHVSFKNADGERKQGGGKAERYALLNENQAYFLLSLSRNTDIVVTLKAKLIRAFGQARRAADLHKTEYLPQYHQLHERLSTLAAGSSNERQVHMNVNKLLNKFAGIEAGQRASAALPQQALLIVGQLVATNQAHGATDHHDAYRGIKTTLKALQGTLALEVAGHE